MSSINYDLDDYEEDETCSARQAFKACDEHGVDILEFVDELGDHQEYSCHDVLGFLGY